MYMYSADFCITHLMDFNLIYGSNGGDHCAFGYFGMIKVPAADEYETNSDQ